MAVTGGDDQMMNLRDLRAFVTVAELGSVGRAAAKLGLTQPAITRRIQNFEAALGHPVLLDRSVKPALLTGTGARVLEQCKRVLCELDTLAQVASDSDDPTGTLRVGVAYGLEELLLSSALQQVRNRYKRLRLQISSGWTVDLIDAARTGSIDCAVILLAATHFVPADLIATRIADDDIVVVSSQIETRKAGGAAWRLGDLRDKDWVLNPAGCGCRNALSRAFELQGHSVPVGAEVHGEQLQLALLVRSGGLGIVPRRQLLRSEFRHALNVVELEDFHLTAVIALVKKRSGGRFNSVVESLEKVLTEQTQKTA
jgi:DNA-binding transcriptional LysR family regulator